MERGNAEYVYIMNAMRTFLIGSAVVVLLALVSLLLWIRTHPVQTPPAVAQTEGTAGNFPFSGEDTPFLPDAPQQDTNQASTTPYAPRTVPIPLANGGTVMVKDFSVTAIPDKDNKGISYLAGEDAGGVIAGTPYVIEFISSDYSFTIALMQEPLGSTRKQAEGDLMKQLGISTQEMCVLRYVVLVPFDISAQYAGKNLGFSFCPGATRLP